MHTAKKINYTEGYKLSVTSNNGKTRIVDLEPYLDKGIFLPLRDPDIFKTVTIIGSTIAWPNGADFCPDVLYTMGTEATSFSKKPLKQKTLKRSTYKKRSAIQ